MSKWLLLQLVGSKPRYSTRECFRPSVISHNVNDLPDVSQDSEVYLFADNAKIFHKITNANDLKYLQGDITRMKNWTEKLLLRFHPAKCKVMSIGHTSSKRSAYKLGDHVLKNSSCQKNLGVNTELNFRKTYM